MKIAYSREYEAKSKNPPYRLYCAHDIKENTLYIVEWAHKKKQPKLIRKIIFTFSKS